MPHLAFLRKPSHLPFCLVIVARKVVMNHKELPLAHRSWVEHILLFIVPRQIVKMGDPSRRSCDACESLGARFKTVIKHLTSRRSSTSKTTTAKRRQRAHFPL